MIPKIKIFADGADLAKMRELARDARIAGFTTNPSLLRKAGVVRYRTFASAVLQAVRGKPVSLEVLSDDIGGMGREARGLAALGTNAVVKVPISTSAGQSTVSLVADLLNEGVAVNVTAVFTVAQVEALCAALRRPTTKKMRGASVPPAALIVSVFAGRIADAGVDPLAHVTRCREALCTGAPTAELLWASPRQVYDIMLAERAGCEIITLAPDLIAKLSLFGKDLEEYSRETVAMFLRDAREAGFEL